MPATRGRDQAWYASLNIDLLLSILQNSVFHPFVASLIPLCLRAAEIPYDSAAFVNTLVYAGLVCLVWLLAPMNERIAYGPRRTVSEDSEVVVITGGANGLGHCLAQIYAHKGITTAVIDVQGPRDPIEGVEYYQCDVSNSEKALRTLQSIEKEVGVPTILINNAGIVASKALLDLSHDEVHRVFHVNTIAQFDLTAAFCKRLIQAKRPGTIVTVASVLGRLGAARLTAYTASKAALIAYHNSLSAELRIGGHDAIKTILVTPGQLSTDMFAGAVQGPVQRFFGPVVEVQQLAMSLVSMIGQGRGGVLSKPAYARWVAILDLLPAGMARLARDLAGIDVAIQDTLNTTKS